MPSMVLAVCLLVLGLSVPAAMAGTQTCFGKAPTIVGTEGNDTIDGTNGNDVIVGLGGNDTIHGLSGTDLICGGNGDDWMFGSGRSVRMSGGPGRDVGLGVVSSVATTVFFGNTGADTFILHGGRHTIDGGGGRDTVVLAASCSTSIDLSTGTASSRCGMRATVKGFENVVDSGDSDHITGDDGPNRLDGGPGSDEIYGLGGDDTLLGRSGTDTLTGGDGFDRCTGGEVVSECEK